MNTTTAELRMIAEIGCSLVIRGQRNEAAQVLQQVNLDQEVQQEGDLDRQAALADVLYLDWLLYPSESHRLERAANMALKAMWYSYESAIIMAKFLHQTHGNGPENLALTGAVVAAIKEHIATENRPSLQVAVSWLRPTG